jgi:rubrerythrin
MSTAQNLQDAFAGESQANRKYTAFARKAEAEGYPNIARLFRAAAEAETVHALAHFRVLGGVKGTADNLQAAVAGEGYEYQQMYPGFVAEAEKEGQKGAMVSFKIALAVEKIHHDLYSQALATLTSGRDLPAAPIMVCDICGNTVVGEAPGKCPICGVGQEHFVPVK